MGIIIGMDDDDEDDIVSLESVTRKETLMISNTNIIQTYNTAIGCNKKS